MANVRIVPPSCDGDGVCNTQGTKVYVDDKEISGVYRIELTADTNDLWRAEIHSYPDMQELNAVGGVIYSGRTWFLRLLHKLFRRKRADITALPDDCRKYDL